MKFYVVATGTHAKPEVIPELTEFMPADDSRTEECTPDCPACGSPTGTLCLAPPYRLELEIVGTRPGDLAFFGNSRELLVSERFKSLYEQSDLVGLEIREPPEIVASSGKKRALEMVPTYYYTRVLPTTTRIDHKASGTIFSEPETYCPVHNKAKGLEAIQRLVIEEESWDGHDIFVPVGISKIVVSERFRDFVEENRITNCHLIPAEDYSFDFYPWHRRSS
jgi:hypothetical protein